MFISFIHLKHFEVVHGTCFQKEKIHKTNPVFTNLEYSSEWIHHNRLLLSGRLSTHKNFILSLSTSRWAIVSAAVGCF